MSTATNILPSIAELITRKKSMYGRYIDTKQWQNFGKVALPDATLNFYNEDGSHIQIGKKALAFDSADSFVQFFDKFFAKASTLHMFGPGEFEQVKPDEVKAIWAMEDEIIMNGTGGLVEIRGGGYYHEVWKEKDGDWFLQSLNLHRTYTKASLLAKVVMVLQSFLGLKLY